MTDDQLLEELISKRTKPSKSSKKSIIPLLERNGNKGLAKLAVLLYDTYYPQAYRAAKRVINEIPGLKKKLTPDDVIDDFMFYALMRNNFFRELKSEYSLVGTRYNKAESEEKDAEIPLGINKFREYWRQEREKSL